MLGSIELGRDLAPLAIPMTDRPYYPSPRLWLVRQRCPSGTGVVDLDRLVRQQAPPIPRASIDALSAAVASSSPASGR